MRKLSDGLNWSNWHGCLRWDRSGLHWLLAAENSVDHGHVAKVGLSGKLGSWLNGSGCDWHLASRLLRLLASAPVVCGLHRAARPLSHIQRLALLVGELNGRLRALLDHGAGRGLAASGSGATVAGA